jgi:hypothetical protein
LSVRERALLVATAGPRFPAPSSMREMQVARERYLSLAPDRAEAWFQLGDALLHFGRALGIPNSHGMAACVLGPAWTLASTFSPALEHLVLLEANAGDTAAVRRLGTSYLSIDSASENADGVRWRMAGALHDTAALAARARRRATMSPGSLHTIQLIAQSDGIDLGSADSVALVRLAHPSSEAPERYAAVVAAHDLALNRGHPARALALTARYTGAGAMPNAALREQVRGALFWDGDQRAGASAARELQRLTAVPPPAAREPRQAYFANLCTVEIWRLAHGDTVSARRSTTLLRDEARTSAGTEMGPFSTACTMIADAMHASVARRVDARVSIDRLDSLLRTGPDGTVREMGNLVVARLKETHGDAAGALAAIRRRDYFLARPAYLSTSLREEARLAALTGDREGAILAYRHYLALRSAPDPALARDARNARAALERLMRQGEPRGTG